MHLPLSILPRWLRNKPSWPWKSASRPCGTSGLGSTRLFFERLEQRTLLTSPQVLLPTIVPAPDSHTAAAAGNITFDFDQTVNAPTVTDQTIAGCRFFRLRSVYNAPTIVRDLLGTHLEVVVAAALRAGHSEGDLR